MALGYGRVGTNNFSCSKFIVDTNGIQNGATHTTIASAITDASDGDVIFIKPGQYTENLTLADGIRLTAFIGDARDGTVEIVGKCSISSGFAVLSGLKLTTNSDYFAETTSTGSLELLSCFLNVADNDGINQTSSGSTTCRACQGNIATTGIKFFNTSAGTLSFRYCNTSNSGASVTASTISGGTTNFRSCEIPMQMSTSSTGTISINNTRMDTTDNNLTILTTAGTGTSEITNSELSSGTASTISIGSGTTVVANDAKLESSNTNTVTGAGTFNYSGISLAGSSSAINPTSGTMGDYLAGRITFNSGTDYLENYQSATWTPALEGSTSNPTVAYTTQTGEYTRIGNMVFIKCNIVINTTSGGSGNLQITGLPFTSANDGDTQYGVCRTEGMNFDGAGAIVSQLSANSATMFISGYTDNAGGATIDVDDIANGDSIRITMQYWV